MRIAHATPYFAPAFVYGGPPRSVLGLCQALDRAGADIQVLTTDANGDGEIAREVVEKGEYGGIAVRYLPRAWPRVYFGARGVTAAVDRLAGAIDVVHLHGCWNVFNWRVARACRRRGVPYIISPRGMLNAWSFEHSGFKKRIAYWLAERRRCAARRCCMRPARTSARKSRRSAVRPIAVIPNGIDRWISPPIRATWPRFDGGLDCPTATWWFIWAPASEEARRSAGGRGGPGARGTHAEAARGRIRRSPV